MYSGVAPGDEISDCESEFMALNGVMQNGVLEFWVAKGLVLEINSSRQNG
jgi:hypothetical protein